MVEADAAKLLEEDKDMNVSRFILGPVAQVSVQHLAIMFLTTVRNIQLF